MDLKSLYTEECKNIVILEAPDYHVYRIYCYLAHKYGYKVTVISHEWLPTVKGIHPLRRPFSNLYTQTFGKYADAILPISEYIIERIKPFGKPYLKVPVLASFDTNLCESSTRDYFLYCVYAAYIREIIPIIEAHAEYSRVAANPLKLVLVLGGNDNQVKVVTDYIEQKGFCESVIVKRKVPYNELMSLYRGAAALIIPLNPDSEQDHARFSQKIAEYCSSGSPIISCRVGEVAYYFEDKKNAVLCEYRKEGFVNAFKWVSTHPSESKKIGKAGFDLGNQYFNYKVLGSQLHSFFEEL